MHKHNLSFLSFLNLFTTKGNSKSNNNLERFQINRSTSGWQYLGRLRLCLVV